MHVRNPRQSVLGYLFCFLFFTIGSFTSFSFSFSFSSSTNINYKNGSSLRLEFQSIQDADTTVRF